MSRPTALITGASSGIGKEFARIAAAEGHDLVLVARRGDLLEQLCRELNATYGVDCVELAIDLSRVDAVETLMRTLADRKITIDVLINAAGFGIGGSVASVQEQRQIDMIAVNIVTLTALTRRLVSLMIDRRRGAILNIASTAAFQACPEMSVYGATKAYVLSFTEGLHEEVRRAGVRVTCLCPGPTETGFADAAGVQKTLLFRLSRSRAHNVAKAGWAGLKRNRGVVIPGLLNRLFVFSNRLSPRFLTRRIAEQLLATP